MTKVILSLRPFKEKQLEALKERTEDYTVASSLDEVSSVSDIEIVYGWNKEEGARLLDSDELNTKWIQLESAGVDYMDLEKLKDKGIVLTNASGIHKYAIAESIMGMLLSYTRGIGHSILMQNQSKWDQVDKAREMNQKTMLIVGAGEIGKQTGKLAKAFGMHTIGVNRSGKNVEYMDEQVTQDDLKKALPLADVVVNILPLTDQTKDLFDLELFKEMKKTAIFINVGRGQTVVTDDLLEALDKGYLEYAALDVVHQEPLPEEHPIYKRKDILLTPHISGTLDDYDESLFPVFEENLDAYLKGEDLPRNVVSYESGY
ncbi:NAD(P)-dependent oxidoreductase [Alkalibacterium pelagium]|uniref:Phosphoglycerate dehydrogenase n=1 Tax=Alkalibacterium pelagium TaxID=426702 RepID=A0A1H7MKQ4_9LACT|nr:NAD(P)-dependent oxidoreductase [Alkalibacterium pelagium]GEN51155.1 2-hydroxyacid dehydrogenase [Alkalibacterium pelagium]SEL11649.1 Phosphoglycerate dehydrogenase [Alkalibacterium pelagium]